MSSQISIMADPLWDTGLLPSSSIGKQFQVGGSFSELNIYFTPTIARQWIETLSKYVEREQ